MPFQDEDDRLDWLAEETQAAPGAILMALAALTETPVATLDQFGRVVLPASAVADLAKALNLPRKKGGSVTGSGFAVSFEVEVVTDSDGTVTLAMPAVTGR